MASLLNPVHAFELFGQAQGAVRVARGVQGFAAIPNVKSAWETASGLVGVIGTDKVVGALVRVAVKLALRAKHSDEDAASEMVERMKAEVPELTGRLANGITFEVDDDGMATVTASAVNPTGGSAADYAVFVEFGTAKMEAEPFFIDAARAVLTERGLSLDNAIGQIGTEEGLT